MQRVCIFLSVILISIAAFGLGWDSGKVQAQDIESGGITLVDETPSPAQLDQQKLEANDGVQVEATRGRQEQTSWGLSQQSYSIKTPYEVYLSGATIVLAISMAVLLCAMAAIGKLTEMFIQSFIVIMAIFAALFLMVAGYDEKQVAPVFGILGSVLGYVFGRAQANRVEPNKVPVQVSNGPAAKPADN